MRNLFTIITIKSLKTSDEIYLFVDIDYKPISLF